MITWHTYDESTYKTTRYNILYWVEETGNPSTTPYIDTKNNPTMGIGFNLLVRRNLDAILMEMGFNVSATGTEGQYITDLRNAVEARNLQQLNTTMNQWASDATVSTHNGKDKRSTFFLDYNEINNVFNTIAPYYEVGVDAWIATYGLTVERYSRERAVFFSLAYNSRDANNDGIPDLLGDNLGKAIKNGNRAEAWFEIRYGSNLGDVPGIAKRRYYESDLFGLYNSGSVDEGEAKTIMRMYTLHKNKIDAYDEKLGMWVAKANEHYHVTWVKTLEDNLNDAKSFLITNFAEGQPIDNVFVGKGLSTYEYKEQGDYNDGNLVGTDKNDLIFGEKGNDTLDGGGNGNTDVMIGGDGNDTYKVDDPNDKIVEKDGEGKELVESTATYTLPANVEDLTLMGTENINGTGNELDNVIKGNTGINILNGGGGNKETLLIALAKTIYNGKRRNVMPVDFETLRGAA